MILRFILKMDSKLLFILNTATFRSVVPGSTNFRRTTKIRHNFLMDSQKEQESNLYAAFFIEQYKAEVWNNINRWATGFIIFWWHLVHSTGDSQYKLYLHINEVSHEILFTVCILQVSLVQSRQRRWTYGVYSIIQQNVSGEDRSRASICIKILK